MASISLHHSFTLYIFHFSSKTCLFTAFMFISTKGSSSVLSFSNSISIKMMCKVKPALKCSFNTYVMLFANCFPVQFGIHSTVFQPTPHPYVIINGIWLTNIMSDVRVTILFCSMILCVPPHILVVFLWDPTLLFPPSLLWGPGICHIIRCHRAIGS